jgi:endoglucanase
MNIMNDTADPFYTSLQAGAYDSKKPSGHPCDPVYSCTPSLSTGGKIAIAVVVTVVGLGIVGGIVFLVVRSRQAKGRPIPERKEGL